MHPLCHGGISSQLARGMRAAGHGLGRRSAFSLPSFIHSLPSRQPLLRSRGSCQAVPQAKLPPQLRDSKTEPPITPQRCISPSKMIAQGSNTERRKRGGTRRCPYSSCAHSTALRGYLTPPPSSGGPTGGGGGPRCTSMLAALLILSLGGSALGPAGDGKATAGRAGSSAGGLCTRGRCWVSKPPPPPRLTTTRTHQVLTAVGSSGERQRCRTRGPSSPPSRWTGSTSVGASWCGPGG